MFIYDDDFLVEEEIKTVETAFYSDLLLWRYFSATSPEPKTHPGVVDTKAIDVPYWTLNSREDDGEYFKFKNIIEKFCIKHGIKYNSIHRIKLNITPAVFTEGTLYPHVDMNAPHLIFLYYVLDSDGDTVLYNEKFTGQIMKPPLTVFKSITPKRGAAFVVDGRHFHSITPPRKHSVRAVINANLMIDSYS